MGVHQRVTVNNAALELRPTPGVPGRSIHISSSPIGIGAVADHSMAVMIQVQDGDVRFTCGGEEPSAETGFSMPPGALLTLHAATANQALFASLTTATLYVQELT